MAEYLSNLGWQRQLARFGSREQRVLQALSNSEFVWRTLSGIANETKLDRNTLEDTVADLIAKDTVVVKLSQKTGGLLFAIEERTKHPDRIGVA